MNIPIDDWELDAGKGVQTIKLERIVNGYDSQLYFLIVNDKIFKIRIQ